MAKHREAAGGGSVAPFLSKCYEMVNDEANKGIVSWSNSRSNSFVINDETQFTLHLLPKYWKHNNFSSFMRQLNIYGFKKIDADRWEFANDGFVKGEKHLLSTIVRRKNIQAAEQKKSVKPMVQNENANGIDEAVENIELWNEVRDLQIDKNALMQELVKLRQHQETADNKLLLLRERLKGMEKNQQQMLSFLVMAVQNPGYFVKLLQPREHNWVGKNANMLDRVMEVSEEAAVSCDEMVATDGTIVRYQQPVYQEEAYCPPSLPSNCFPYPEIEMPDGMEEFFMNSDLMKTLMDENEPMLDDQGQFVLPNLHDDALLDHYIFNSPLPLVDNNAEYANPVSPLKGLVKMQQMEPVPEPQIELMDVTTTWENGNTRNGSTAPKAVYDAHNESQELARLTKLMKDLDSNSNTITEVTS